MSVKINIYGGGLSGLSTAFELSKYDFDRKKIIGIMCDQGSNFVSAFKSPPITTKEGI